jgi:predicted nucleic acid-binding protein
VEAITAELTGALDEALHASELIEPEALNALRRLARIGAQADRAVTELDELRLIRYPHAALRDRVWALRENLSAYDALYLALAESLPGSVLFTGDAGLAANAARSLGDQRVRHLA